MESSSQGFAEFLLGLLSVVGLRQGCKQFWGFGVEDPDRSVLEMWVVEAGDCEFGASLGYIGRPCLKKPKNSQVPMTHACNPNYSGEKIRRFKDILGKKFTRPYLGNTQPKRGLVERLPSKCEALSSNPNTTKQTNKTLKSVNGPQRAGCCSCVQFKRHLG
jgi:hypothetical protein